MPYIDRDTAIRTAIETCVQVAGHGITQIDAVNIANAFEDIPAADVIEIVRCKNCKYGDVSVFSKTRDGQEDVACLCNLKKRVTDVDSYCPSGRRRSET